MELELIKSEFIEEKNNILERIDNTFREYYEKYYISPEKRICKKIYLNMSKALSLNGKILCKNSSKDTENIEYYYDKKALIKCLYNVVELLLTHYNIELAECVGGMFRKIENDIKMGITEEEYRKIDPYLKIGVEVYFMSHKEYVKIMDIFDLYEEIEFDNWSYIDKVLKEFEEKILEIPTIEDKYLRSAICEYFKDGLIFEV